MIANGCIEFVWKKAVSHQSAWVGLLVGSKCWEGRDVRLGYTSTLSHPHQLSHSNICHPLARELTHSTNIHLPGNPGELVHRPIHPPTRRGSQPAHRPHQATSDPATHPPSYLATQSGEAGSPDGTHGVIRPAQRMDLTKPDATPETCAFTPRPRAAQSQTGRSLVQYSRILVQNSRTLV